MPDLLGATNPVPGHERNAIVHLPPEQEKIPNIADPGRVSRPEGRTEQQDNNLNGKGNIRYDSNFHVFLKRLRSAPDLTDSLQKIISYAENVVVSSGIKEGSASELSELITMMKMDEAELMQFFLSQIKAGTQFGGALFTVLRNAYNRSNSESVQNDILQFLKCYVDYFSSSHLEGNILGDLAKMASSMPASWAEKLNAMTEQLTELFQSGNKEQSVQLLQRNVFPYMNSYISRNHDMGLPRQVLTHLMLEVARYENGTQENLLEAFHQIRGYGMLKKQLAPIDDRTLMMLLQSGRADSQSPAVRFADQLAKAAAQAMRGGEHPDVQQAYQEIMRAVLINESVYMPLNHYMLPLEMDGRHLFSEMWIDPDAGSNESDKNSGRKENVIKCLFKLDVENLGMIDVVLLSRDKDVDIQLNCSDHLLTFSQKIEQGIDAILRKNDLKPVRVTVRKMDHPLTLTEVFPKIYERKDSLNVKV